MQADSTGEWQEENGVRRAACMGTSGGEGRV